MCLVCQFTFYFCTVNPCHVSSGQKPAECNGMQPYEMQYQDQGSRFVLPPKPDQYDYREMDRNLIYGITTNAFPIAGKILNNDVHAYLVTYQPPIGQENTVARRNVLLGANKREAKRNERILFEFFGKVADVHRACSFSLSLFSHLNSSHTLTSAFPFFCFVARV